MCTTFPIPLDYWIVVILLLFLIQKYFFNLPTVVNCSKPYYRILLPNEDITVGLCATDPLTSNLCEFTLMHHTLKSQYHYLTSSTRWLLWNLCNIFHQHPKSRTIKVVEIDFIKSNGHHRNSAC